MPEFRKVQMVMLETEQEEASVKDRIRAGEITMFQAASEHSVALDAKQNLGETGWVARGTLKPEIEAVVFVLAPTEIGGPAQTGEDWTLAEEMQELMNR